MRNYLILLSLFFGTICSSAQAQHKLRDGAYLAQDGKNKNVMLIIDHYLSCISYDDTGKQFRYTWGGQLAQRDNILTIVVEYDTRDSTLIGQQLELPYTITNDSLLLKQPNSQQLFIKQKTQKQRLDGLWRISGRQQGDKMQTIAKADRKTIKILIDGYFQWIAINPAVKGFYGTGGGYYTFKNNRYTEKIAFFSRDNNRVGQELNFDGTLVENVWHHKGKSSKGDDIYETWSREILK